MAARGTVVQGGRSGFRGKPLQVVGQQALIANLYAKQADIVAAMQEETERTARDVVSLAQQLAPVDEGNHVRSLTYELSPDRRAFTAYHDPSFFPGPPYHVFQELGFRHAGSGEFIQNAHLLPAYQAIAPDYSANISAAARRAIERGR